MAKIKVKHSSKSKQPEKTSHNEVSKKQNTKKSDEMNQNLFQQILKFKHFKTIGIILTVFVLMTIALHVRTGAVDYEGNWVCKFKQNFDSDLQCGLLANVKSSVLNSIQNQIQAEVLQRYPNVDQAFLQQEVATRMQTIIETNTFQGVDLDVIAQQQLDAYVQSFQSDDRVTYLTAIDPYYYLGLSTMYYENGFVGDELKDGDVPHYSLRLAPNGINNTKLDFHTFLMAQMYSFNGVDRDGSSYSDRINAVFTLPAIIAMLTMIPLFFLIRGFSNVPFAFVTSLMLTTTIIYVSRTQSGFVDTDAYNIFFPVLISCFLYYAYKVSRLEFKVVLSILASISSILFVWAWSSSWFFILFILVAMLGVLAYEFLIKLRKDGGMKNMFSFNFKEEFFKVFSITAAYFILLEVLFIIFRKDEVLNYIYTAANTSINSLTRVSADKMWPNVLSSVAELNSASFNSIISSLITNSSSTTLFLIVVSLAGLMYSFVRSIPEDKITLFKMDNLMKIGISLGFGVYSYILFSFANTLTRNNSELFLILLFLPILIVLIANLIFKVELQGENLFVKFLIIIWFAGGVYMSLNGTRFILLLAPAFALLIAYGCYNICMMFAQILKFEFKGIDVSKWSLYTSIVFCVFLYLLVSPQVDRAYAISNSNLPNFDDNWYGLMEFMQNNTDEDAIVNSWWDFGHFFVSIGQRSVFFDGASQGTPNSYWVGHWLMQNDEDVAVDIIRMQSCSGNGAYEYVLKEMDDSRSRGVHSFNLINDLMGLSKDEKRAFLENYSRFDFSNNQVDKILELVHCEDPRQVIAVASGDMVGKAGVWAHWGSWSFERKYVHSNYKTQSVEEISEIIEVPIEEVQQMVDELEEIDTRVRTLNLNRNNLENNWLAPYPSYLQPIQCDLQGPVVNCRNQMLINLSDQNNVSIIGTVVEGMDVSRVLVPSSIEDFLEYQIKGTNELDLVVIPDLAQNSAQVLIAQYPLGGSMFTRLHYLNGHGADKFNQLRSAQTQTAGRVSLWDVNFDEVNEDDQLAAILENLNSQIQEQVEIINANYTVVNETVIIAEESNSSE